MILLQPWGEARRYAACFFKGLVGRGGQSLSPGNSAFGHSQAGSPQTGSANSQYGQSTAAQARFSSSSDREVSTDQDNDRKKRKKAKSKKAVRTASGNSAFGHKQGDADTRTTGRQNSRFGRATARAAKERHDNSNPRPTATASPSANVSSSESPNAQGGPGNSEFGLKQGNAETRTTGEQNAQFGRATAEQAKAGYPAPSPSATASPAP